MSEATREERDAKSSSIPCRHSAHSTKNSNIDVEYYHSGHQVLLFTAIKAMAVTSR
jgi:hypothetical protein